MKAAVDKDTCIACGLCPSICPECFEIEDDGKAGFIVDEAPDGTEGEAVSYTHLLQEELLLEILVD